MDKIPFSLSAICSKEQALSASCVCDESRPGVTSDCYVLGGLIDIYCRFLEYNDRFRILLHRCIRNGFSLETQQVAKFEIKKKTLNLKWRKRNLIY